MKAFFSRNNFRKLKLEMSGDLYKVIDKIELQKIVNVFIEEKIFFWYSWKYECHGLKTVHNFVRLSKIYRGSYMSAHVLLNLLNKLGKSDKMQGLQSILSIFRNKFH